MTTDLTTLAQRSTMTTPDNELTAEERDAQIQAEEAARVAARVEADRSAPVNVAGGGTVADVRAYARRAGLPVSDDETPSLAVLDEYHAAMANRSGRTEMEHAQHLADEKAARAERLRLAEEARFAEAAEEGDE